MNTQPSRSNRPDVRTFRSAWRANNDSADRDGELLQQLAEIGARTTTCPCGYGVFDTCPVHDN